MHLHSIKLSHATWERLTMYCIGPATESQSDNKYILVLTDLVSKIFATKAVPDNTSLHEPLVRLTPCNHVRTIAYHPQTTIYQCNSTRHVSLFFWYRSFFISQALIIPPSNWFSFTIVVFLKVNSHRNLLVLTPSSIDCAHINIMPNTNSLVVRHRLKPTTCAVLTKLSGLFLVFL